MDIEHLVKKIESEIPKLLNVISRRAKINRNWDFALTILSIILTLGISTSGVLGEEVIGKNRSKILAGLFGAGIVAIETVGRSIPIKERRGGYRFLEAQLINLEFELMYMQNDDGKLDIDEINLLIGKLHDIRKEAARLEGNPVMLLSSQMSDEISAPSSSQTPPST